MAAAPGDAGAERYDGGVAVWSKFGAMLRDVMTIYPAAVSISAMIERLRALPTPPAIERRDEEEMPERARL